MGKELNRYIKKELKKGFTLKQIKNTLLKTGYKKDIVSDAISGFKEKKLEVEVKSKFMFPWKKLFLIVLVLFVLLILSFFGYKFISKVPKIEEPSMTTFLPTVEDFYEEGWVMKYDGPMGLYWSEERKETARQRGLIERYVRTFSIEGKNFSDVGGKKYNSLGVSFSISRYPRGNISQVMEHAKNELQNKGIDYSQLPNQFEVEKGKVIIAWEEAIESLEITDNRKNKCIRLIREDMLVGVCCIYYKEAWEETCTYNLWSKAESISYEIKEYYDQRRDSAVVE